MKKIALLTILAALASTYAIAQHRRQLGLTPYDGYWWQKASMSERNLYISGAVEAFTLGEAYIADTMSHKTAKQRLNMLKFGHVPLTYYVTKVTSYYAGDPKRLPLEVSGTLICIADNPPSYCQ